MNKLLPALTLALIVACPPAGFCQSSYESDPAYLAIDKALDLKTIKPEVNINLPHFLLKDAVSELSGVTNGPLAGKGAELAEMIKDVKLIRLVVIEADKTNRPALDKAVKTLRGNLESKWTSVITVPQDNVGIYAMGDPSGESVAGLAVLVNDGGDAVIGNIVGRVPIGKLIKMAAQMDKLPKDLVKQFQKMANKGDSSAASSSGGDAGTDEPVETQATGKESTAK